MKARNLLLNFTFSGWEDEKTASKIFDQCLFSKIMCEFFAHFIIVGKIKSLEKNYKIKSFFVLKI